ncbi:MAG: rhodanese-like domain-containing protein [Deltaproteobacteria bacterium]|nr:MAG: rhodanese-like domain-containing protein [Deltaproteobacteria bacterium]RLA97809.1 MAG: rhodanese-like domain-containing protein [Deltaproteobacteria bacterium]
MTAKDFVAEAKAKIKEISVAEAKAKIESGAPLVVLDVREPKEYKKGHLPKAVNLPRGLLEFKVNKVIPNKDAYVIVYCKSGGRSALATLTLKRMGYKNAVSMAGGWKAWVKAGYPIE